MKQQYKARSEHYMNQLCKDIVRMVGFLGVSDHLNMASFGRLVQNLKDLRAYSRMSDEEMFHLLEKTDRRKWTYWTIRVVVKGERKWVCID